MQAEKNWIKISKEDGLKNPADVFDAATFEEIKKEIEAEIADVKDYLEIPDVSEEDIKNLPNIKEDFEYAGLNPY